MLPFLFTQHCKGKYLFLIGKDSPLFCCCYLVLGAVCYRRGQLRKSTAYQEISCQSRHLLLSGGAVRRNSLRCAPFGPPTVSCVLAPARTCLRQAPPTSRGRGLATSAVLYHLTDDMSIDTIFLGNAVKCFIFAFAYVFTHPR